MTSSQTPIIAPSIDSLRHESGEVWQHMAKAQSAAIERRALVGSMLSEADLISADTSLVVFGSLARGEFTSGSDCDWTMLVDGKSDPGHFDTSARVARALKSLGLTDPGPSGLFGSLSFSHELVHEIGGEDDSNRNTTRRILLLLESAPIAAGDSTAVRERVVRCILRRYFDEDARTAGAAASSVVPRYLLNDISRFWRTLGVDYARKVRDRGGQGWALRNIKLRISRKLLYASGLLVCFGSVLDSVAAAHETEPLLDLERRLAIPPLEHVASRVRQIKQENERIEIAKDIFGAYDAFLGMLDDSDQREHLKNLPTGNADSDPAFCAARENGRRFQKGLLRLFFGSGVPKLADLTKEYGVF